MDKKEFEEKMEEINNFFHLGVDEKRMLLLQNKERVKMVTHCRVLAIDQKLDLILEKMLDDYEKLENNEMGRK